MNNNIFALDRLEQVANELKTFISGNTVIMLRHHKNGTVHNLVPANIGLLEGLSFCMFIATDNFDSGDTIAVNGKAAAIKLNHSASIDGLFVAGDCVSLSYDSSSNTIFIMNPHEYKSQKRWEFSAENTGSSASLTWYFPDDGVYRIVAIGSGCVPSDPRTNLSNYKVVSGVPGVGGAVAATEIEIQAGSILSIQNQPNPLPVDPTGNLISSPKYQQILYVMGNNFSLSIAQPIRYGYMITGSGSDIDYTFTPGLEGKVLTGNMITNTEYQVTVHDETIATTKIDNITYEYVKPINGGQTSTLSGEYFPAMLKQYITDAVASTRIDTSSGIRLSFMTPLKSTPLLGEKSIRCYGLGGSTGIAYRSKLSDELTWSNASLKTHPKTSDQYGMNNWGVFVEKLS